MSIIRSDRTSAYLLLGAAVLGLVLANSPAGELLLDIQHAHLGIPGVFDPSIGHWISDGLLAIFFFTVAVELKHELIDGELNSVAKAIHPAIAAVGGVIVPAGIYLAITAGSGYERGWPVSTATDIAFALGVLAIFGRGLPNRLRVFLLALAVIDDLIAILIIAVFFTTDADLVLLGVAVLALVAFAFVTRRLTRRNRLPLGILAVLLAALTWVLVYESGVHATIAGVALGLAMPGVAGGKAYHALEPWVNGLVLPLFAFSAALVALPAVSVGELLPPFWAILVALPVGKIVGITIGALLGSLVRRDGERRPLTLGAVLPVAALGGIGFTVSLLMNDLAFAGEADATDQGTLAVLAGSGVSIVVAAVLVARRAAWNRRQHPVSAETG